ncbi:rRNA maturation RNase YbeY [soil metagenome]
MILTEIIVIRHNETALDLPDLEIERAIIHALECEEQSGEWVVSIVLTDDAEMQRMHRDFMNIDEPTDVMTFPSDFATDEEHGGDIVISVERAAEQGSENGLTPEQEVTFLAVHGVLHLCGWDDHAEEDRAAMLERQRVIIASIKS